MAPSVPDVRKTVVVAAEPAQAFAVFAERPLEWFPPHHVFVTDRVALTIEPRVGGRYVERGADGTEIAWGTVLAWEPPHRIDLTWRVGPGWSPLVDDEGASVIRVAFAEAGPGRTRVELTHAELHRHGDIAGFVHSALDGPSPGETLARYAEVVARHVPAPVPTAATAAPTAPGLLAPAELTRLLRECSGDDEAPALDATTLGVDLAELGYDSLALLAVVGRLQRERGTTIDDDALAAVRTPQDLITVVEAALAAGSPGAGRDAA